MERLIRNLLGLVALGTLISPVKALTEEEVAVGIQLAGCFRADGCYYQNRRPQFSQPYYHPNPYYNSQPSYNYNNPHNFRRSPQIIIVPAQPQYRYTPPYSGYYFERDRRNFRHQPHNFSYGYRQDVRGQINQIYINVLGRNADIDGLNTYQDRYNNGWSLIDIQRDIANSHEARNLRRF